MLGPCQAVFGQPIAYTPTGGAAFPITGIYDDEYLNLVAIERGGMEQMGFPGNTSETRPVLGVQLSQFPAPPAQGDALTLMLPADVFPAATGASYVVMEVRPDSHGAAKLLLNLAP